MMLRTKATTYAILAVVEIAEKQRARHGGVQAGEVARCVNIPGAYAAKVLTQLARANLLRSDRGPRGGFRLVRPPEEITLLNIVEAVDGTIESDSSGINASSSSEASLRAIDRAFQSAVDSVRQSLEQYTIADLLQQAPVLVGAHSRD